MDSEKHLVFENGQSNLPDIPFYNTKQINAKQIPKQYANAEPFP